LASERQKEEIFSLFVWQFRSFGSSVPPNTYLCIHGHVIRRSSASAKPEDAKLNQFQSAMQLENNSQQM
jgi:hypothetical protein